ncbi:MAG: hypothetical protein GXP15_03095 [Gammaproteobacteria bacterium]|nr:hypothetical protein [Gammaproteobacteria bacterium]
MFCISSFSISVSACISSAVRSSFFDGPRSPEQSFIREERNSPSGNSSIGAADAVAGWLPGTAWTGAVDSGSFCGSRSPGMAANTINTTINAITAEERRVKVMLM